jgi:hypothetical protein
VYEDEDRNLDIAINLQDTTYTFESGMKTLKTKVLFAIYHDLGISQKIDEDKEVFKNFYTFANFERVITWENIIDEELDMMAKLIHYTYEGAKEINLDELNKKWLAVEFFKRDSSRVQALHIDIKLLALGLKKQKSKKPLDELLKINKAIFQKKLGVVVDEDSYKFPQKESKDMLFLLANAEHNRWNSFYYLNGWEHGAREDKAKRHNCLIPFSKFSKEEKKTYKYDVQSVVNIPIYLAYGGYEIVEIKNKNDMIVKKN